MPAPILRPAVRVGRLQGNVEQLRLLLGIFLNEQGFVMIHAPVSKVQRVEGPIGNRWCAPIGDRVGARDCHQHAGILQDTAKAH